MMPASVRDDGDSLGRLSLSRRRGCGAGRQRADGLWRFESLDWPLAILEAAPRRFNRRRKWSRAGTAPRVPSSISPGR